MVVLRVVREERRDLERHPAVDAVRALEDRKEQIGRLPEVLLRQREEQRFAGLALRELRADRRIVRGAGLDGLIEDRRIRRESGHRQFGDVAPERAGREEVTRDVIEPEALAQVVELLRHLHGAAPSSWRFAVRRAWRAGDRNP